MRESTIHLKTEEQKHTLKTEGPLEEQKLMHHMHFYASTYNYDQIVFPEQIIQQRKKPSWT